MTLQDAMALQTDDHSMLGRRVAALYAALEAPADLRGESEVALDLLANWDGEVAVDSPAAVLHEMLVRRHLGEATVDAVVPEAYRDAVGNGYPASVLELLETPDERLGAEPEAGRDAVLLQALDAAVAEAGELLGGEPTDWRWGSVHRATFVPDVAPLLSEADLAQMTVGPLAMGGSASTPRAASYRPDFSISAGASFRMVLDVGNWDASRAINTPGQSGDPASAHYRDLAPLWAAGEFVPLSYSRKAVEQNARTVLQLTPAD